MYVCMYVCISVIMIYNSVFLIPFPKVFKCGIGRMTGLGRTHMKMFVGVVNFI